jgi:hypothetical protein
LVISDGLQPVLQAAVCGGLSFDPISFCQDGATPPQSTSAGVRLQMLSWYRRLS